MMLIDILLHLPFWRPSSSQVLSSLSDAAPSSCGPRRPQSTNAAAIATTNEPAAFKPGMKVYQSGQVAVTGIAIQEHSVRGGSRLQPSGTKSPWDGAALPEPR